MKKLMEKEQSYYRLNLHAGNILYFSHAKDVREDEYIELDIKDVVAKVDELVEAFSSLSTTVQNIATELSDLKKNTNNMILALEKPIKIETVISEEQKPIE